MGVEEKRSSLQADQKGRNDEQRQSLQADRRGRKPKLDLEAVGIPLGEEDKRTALQEEDSKGRNAVSIASTEKLMFNIQNITGLKDILEENLPKDAIAVSLPYGHRDICELPERVSKIEFTQLRTLRLQCLPQLTSFGSKEFTPDTGSQEILAEDELGSFISSFSQNVCSSSSSSCSPLSFSFCIGGIINTEELRGEGRVVNMVFPKLINLQLKGLPNLTQFASGNSVEFPSLTQLSIQDCPKLKTFSATVMSADIKQSEEVEMNCQDDIHPLFNQKVVLPTLASLNLSSICIQIIWDKQLQPMSSCFQKLTKLIVDGCDTLKDIFSSSMVESLIQLEVLEISNCKFMERVITIDGESISSTLFPKLYQLDLKHLSELTSFCSFAGNSIELPTLADLWLENCPKMHTFVSNSPSADMPASKEEPMSSDENLQSQTQPLFDEKVQLPNLKFLRIYKMDNLRKMWHHQLVSASFSKIDYFEILHCNNLQNVFPLTMFGRLQNLGELIVVNCNSLEKIFEEVMMEEIVAKEDVPRLVFPQLIRLQLADLPSLKSFYPGLYILEWPKLKMLRMWRCNKVEILTSEFLSIQRSHGESQLEKAIREPLFIVDKAAFPKLEQLALEWNWIVKEMLRRNFTEYSCNLKFLELLNATKQSAICPSCFLYTLSNLERLEVSHGSFEEIFIFEGLDCKEKQVGFRGMENLTFSEFPHLKEVWHNQFPVSFFSNLKSLVLDNDCSSLRYIFIPSVALYLVQLQELKITNCAILETIVDIKEERIDNTMFPNLNRLELKDLPKLSRFCNFAGNSIKLPSLTQLWIENCPNMETFIFDSIDADRPASKENFHREIQPFFDEKFMEEVIITNGERISNNLFPKLYRLHLKHLLELTSFCNFAGNSIVFPSLAQLWLENCPKMHTFVSNSPRADMPASKEEPISSEENLQSQTQPLFDEKNVFPLTMFGRLQNLGELLVVSCNSLEKIFEEVMMEEIVAKEDVPRLVFPQLLRLELTDLPSLKSFYPGLYILEWPKLKMLRMWRCNKVEILTSEFLSNQKSHGESQLENAIREVPLFIVDKVAFPNLEDLSLEWNCIAKESMNENFSGNSCKLKHLQLIDASKEAALCPCFFLYKLPNLEKLTVTDGVLEEMFICKGHGCKEKYIAEASSKLNYLWLVGLNDSLNLGEENSLLCKIFQNLTTLEVLSCNELKALVSSTVTFQNLTTLEVSKSGGLINLMAISTAKSLVQLARLKIIECKMIEEIGALSTPGLHKLQTKEAEEGFWEGSLNTTIQKLFKDMDGFRGIENFTVSDFPQLKEAWHKQLLDCYFSNLKSLVVDDKCSSLTYVFTPSVALDLVKLEELEIKNCAVLEVIMVIEEGTKVNTLFPNLHTLKLRDLPKLSSFCNFAGNAIELPSLATLRIENCPNMQTFISNSIGADMSTSKDNLHTAIQPLFDEKHIWDVDSQGLLTCHNLISIEVQRCGSLKSIFPASVGRNLLRLEELLIETCCMVEEIFAKEEQVDEAVPRFPQLMFLRLAELPRLRSFYPRVNVSEWPMLKKLHIWKCDKIKVSASKYLSFQVSQGESQHEMPMEQPLLLLDKVPFNNLDSLQLDWKWIVKEALHEKLPEYSCKLKDLTFVGFHSEADVCVSCFLHKLPHLEKLIVYQGFFKEIFSYKGFGCEEKHAEAPKAAEGKGFWEGNLNTTIEHLFIESCKED
ncbi:hypothetical protein QYF36_025280 [Acer negundo]|nr:hypothetical protein QYF36_025280 [Acer negundo]